MNITKKDLSSTHAIISVSVTKEDYQEKTEKILKDYKKTATIPGFRKGMVPMSHIIKQYGDAIKYEEVNKMVEKSLNEFIAENKIDVLGQPIPIINELMDIKQDNFTLEYEVGVAPKFDLDLPKTEVTYYKIIADDKMVNEQIESIKKQFGTKIVKEAFEAGNDIQGTVTNEENNINAFVDFNCEIFDNKKIEDLLIGKKSGETVVIPTKGLFDDNVKLLDFLRVAESIGKDLDADLTLEIKDILDIQKSELNQELFDKLYGEGTITSEADLKARVKEDIEKQYVQHTDSNFLNSLDKKLIDSSKIELPKEFLTRWIQTTAKNEISIEDAAVEYEKSENALKYQLIEAKIINDNNLQITYDELRDFTASQIKQQMMMYGMKDFDDKMIEETTARILSKREEVERQSGMLKERKLISFYKETVKMTTKEVTVDQFIKEING